MTAPYPAPQCRLDLVKPAIIFGSALLLSAVFCGALDSMSAAPGFVEEVQVVRAEGAAGGHDADLLVSCQHDRSNRVIRDVRCRSLQRSRFSQAALH